MPVPKTREMSKIFRTNRAVWRACRKTCRGAIPRLKGACSLRDDADDATLARFNIPEALRSGFNGNTIFVMQKNDHLLWP
jgi:hypothetical protein